jgi:hypothetical protein
MGTTKTHNVKGTPAVLTNKRLQQPPPPPCAAFPPACCCCLRPLPDAAGGCRWARWSMRIPAPFLLAATWRSDLAPLAALPPPLSLAAPGFAAAPGACSALRRRVPRILLGLSSPALSSQTSKFSCQDQPQCSQEVKVSAVRGPKGKLMLRRDRVRGAESRW